MTQFQDAPTTSFQPLHTKFSFIQGIQIARAAVKI